MAKAHRHGRIQEHSRRRGLNQDAPVGVFDSGVGGLSVLRALRAALPGEDFVYMADGAYAPYGERGDAFVADRSLSVSQQLQDAYGVKALVVACNTATASAIARLRSAWPLLPIVGVEPALKPAAALTRTGRVGVMATRGTLASDRLRTLADSLEDRTHFALQPCDGLADAIEQDDAPRIQTLCQQYTAALGPFGAEPGQIDTLVLGCTHYPFAAQVLRRLVGPHVHMLDTGDPVARQTRNVLSHNGLLAARESGRLTLRSTADAATLHRAAARWLDLQADA